MEFEELYVQIKNRVADSAMSTIGIVGLPGSGKSTMSVNLGRYLATRNIAAVPWEGDIYSTSDRSNRTAMIKANYKDRIAAGQQVDPNWPRTAYHYDLDLMIKHFDKLKRREDFSAKGLCHPKRKSLDLEVSVNFSDQRNMDVLFEDENFHYEGNSTWLLADFALLTKKEIRESLDVLVYVEAEYSIRADRIRRRLQSLPQPLTLEEDLFKSIESSQIRDFDVRPESCQILINNNDYDHPRIVRA